MTPFCQFSDDTFYVIKEDSIETISFLSEKYISIYKDALRRVDKEQLEEYEEEEDISEDIIMSPSESLH